jgi:hypothetical protein
MKTYAWMEEVGYFINLMKTKYFMHKNDVY